jgi:hypothetical protein
MHTQPMADSDGTFGDEKPATGVRCRKCDGRNITVRTWESSCGGYEDEKYSCGDCGHYWWVEGPDS